MAKKLNMVFTRGESGTKTISLAEPKDGITASPSPKNRT